MLSTNHTSTKLTIPVNQLISTGGDGLWSNTKKYVKVENIEVIVKSNYLESNNSDSWDLNEWNAYLESTCDIFFDEDSWDIHEEGLIYTDKTFMSEICKILKQYGINQQIINNITYSEQDMQGDDYVNCKAQLLAIIIAQYTINEADYDVDFESFMKFQNEKIHF